MTRNYRIMTTIAACAVMAAAWSQAKPKPVEGTALDTEIASVELIRKTPVSLKKLKLDVGRLEGVLGKQMTLKDREQYLDLMINDILFLQQCERLKVSVTDTEISQVVQQMKGQVMAEVQANPQAVDKSTLTNWASTGTISDDSFYEILGKMGVETADVKNYVKKRLLLKKYLATRQKEIDAVPKPTYDDVAKYYEDHKADLMRPDAVKLSLLYVDTRTTPEADKRKAKETAEGLYSKVRGNSAKFNELVLRSMESKSGYIGLSDYLYARTDDFKTLFGENFFNAALGLKKGEISTLLEGPTGYHVLMAVEVYPKKQLELNDPIAIDQKGSVYEYLANLMYTEKANGAVQTMLNDLVKELRAKAKIKVKSELLAW
jgi:parvulin-like peptidyl-prolyl isomerase